MTYVDIQLINQLLNPRKRRVLALAELAMSQTQYERFKSEFLSELGNSGFIRDLEKEFTKSKAR
jgi:hypothetical protein